MDGQRRCYDYFNYFCDEYATTCKPASATFTSTLKGESCTVMIRTDIDGKQIKGYATVCGPIKPTTPEMAFNQLRSMSSIFWADGVLVSDGAKTGIIAYTTSDTSYSYAAYISASTGQMLLLVRKALTTSLKSSLSVTTWGAADDLGTSCGRGEMMLAFSSGNMPMVGEPTPYASYASYLLLTIDVYRSLRQAVKPSLRPAVASIAAPDPEFVFFVTSP